jgi:hypothetical protein
MLRRLGIVIVAAAIWAAAPALPAAAKEGAMTPAATAATDASAQKVRRARKPSVRRFAAAPVAAPAPYYQQCFLFFCNNGRPYRWLVLGVAY